MHLVSEDTLSSLAAMGFDKPTPIQSSALPHILENRDLIGKAPTGSGKTLAFGIPIFQRWATKQQETKDETSRSGPVALIIEPARELAHQIESHLSKLRTDIDAKIFAIATLTGGFSSQKQKRLLDRADVVIATPGRLWDVMSHDTIVLQALRGIDFLVIDEADRLLSQGHFQELEQILNALDRRAPQGEEDEDDDSDSHQSRQTLVFSATFAKELQHKLGKLSKHKFSKEQGSMGYLLQRLNFRQQPKFIDINPETQMADKLVEALLEVSDSNKDLYLYALLLLFQPREAIRALVFVNSISAVRRLVPFLQLLNFEAVALHSNMEQKARLSSLERFTQLKKSGLDSKSSKQVRQQPNSPFSEASGSIWVEN